MKQVINALKELRNSIFSIGIFASLIDSLIVMLISVLVFMLLEVPWYYSLIPFGIYFLIHHKRKMKETRLAYVEEKFPDLNEQLRTAADNIDKDNEVVESLNFDVLRKMRGIRTSAFVKMSRLYREMMVIAVLAFVVIGISAYNIHIINYKDLLGKAKALNIGKGDIGEAQLIFEEGTDEDIYGEEIIAELGNEEIVLQINPVLSDVDLSKIEKVREREFSEGKPLEIAATTDSSYEESIPKNYQQIVKKYFGGITKYR